MLHSYKRNFIKTKKVNIRKIVRSFKKINFGMLVGKGEFCMSIYGDYSLKDIEITNAYLMNGFNKMAEYLKKFDIDRSVEGFRRTAGIGKEKNTYEGWETSLIAGHAIGHFVTALAQGYAYSQGNRKADKKLLEMSEEIIEAFDEAQIKQDKEINGEQVRKGFLFASTEGWNGASAVYGERQFDNIENNRANIITEAWVPWYTMHKILAGLIDTHKFTGNTKALEIASFLGDWVYNRVSKYDEAMQKKVLNIEYGGMNDCLYELYKFTRKPEHAKAAHVFDEIPLFDKLYEHIDVLENKHANTTIPKIIGALNRYRVNEETNGELLNVSEDSRNIKYYLIVAENFWDIVVNGHSYITGGNSENEHFRTPMKKDKCRNHINCETCNTYNMLKLTRELFKITGNKKYADFYENTFLNAIISSQNPETGMTMYFQPMGTGYFKVFSSEFKDFWCCTGSGMENFTKLNDSIYFKGKNEIIVNQYISSILTDKENNISLVQNSFLPDRENVLFEIQPLEGEKQHAKVKFRVPDWIARKPIVKLNRNETEFDILKGYIEIEKDWTAGDVVEIILPMEMRVYGLSDNENVVAFKYGPVVLSAGLGVSDIEEKFHGMAVRVPKHKTEVNEFIKIDENYGTREKWLGNLAENMIKTNGELIFTMKNTDQKLIFTPHYRRYKERYGIYWYLIDENFHKDIEDVKDYNIIDFVEFAHDQQENGHGYIQDNSVGIEGTGDMPNYREIKLGGFVSYQMLIDKTKKNYLMLNFSKDDKNKKINIYAGDIFVAGADIENNLYEIPKKAFENSYIAGKDAITIAGKEVLKITFKAECGTDAPKLCKVVEMITK